MAESQARRILERIEQKKEKERQIMLKYYDWIEPSYEKPKGIKISEEEQREEDEFYRENPTAPKAMWSSGGWVVKKDDEPPRKKRKLSTMEPKAEEAIEFSKDTVEPPIPCSYIADPRARIVQCIKILCGNHGVLVDSFISLYIGQKGIPTIIEEVFSVLDPEFLQFLEIPQDTRAESAKAILKPLDLSSTEKVVYMGLLKIPPKASFWSGFRHAFPVGRVDESVAHDMMYIGSAAAEKGGVRQRIGKQHESESYREKNPRLFYAAMDEPETARSWWRIGAAKKDEECRALIRIAEAVAIATTHTYTSDMYTTLLKEFGVVEENSLAFGCNRTSAMKDFTTAGQPITTSPVQRIMHQILLEKYGGPTWTFEGLPEVVKRWLVEEGFGKDKMLTLARDKGKSLASAIHAEMTRLGGKATSSMKKELTIQNALAGGLFTVRGSWKGGMTVPKITFLNIGINIKTQLLKDGLINVNDQINVDFPIFDLQNADCYATDALHTDPGRLLGICLRGRDDSGEEWSHYLQAGGEKAAMRANTIFDWLTDTGIAQADHKIPRRYYREAKDGRWVVEYT